MAIPRDILDRYRSDFWLNSRNFRCCPFPPADLAIDDTRRCSS